MGTSSTDSQQAGHRRCSTSNTSAENLTCLSLPGSPGKTAPLPGPAQAG
ncbi:CEMP1 isoform 1 [Pan troglodytes]|nr:CEMP1 isoform 1 [Pan troglodytes]